MMKFLLDQDVYASTGRFLRGLAHDAVPAAELGLSFLQKGIPLLVVRNPDT